jgi:hypothetical protein
MSQSRSLLELASVVQKKVAIVVQTLKDNDLAPPSFDAGAPLNSQIPDTIEETKMDILQALGDLQALLYGPMYHVQYLSSMIVSFVIPS